MGTILDLINEKIQGVVPTQKLNKYFGQTEKTMQQNRLLYLVNLFLQTRKNQIYMAKRNIKNIRDNNPLGSIEKTI